MSSELVSWELGRTTRMFAVDSMSKLNTQVNAPRGVRHIVRLEFLRAQHRTALSPLDLDPRHRAGLGASAQNGTPGPTLESVRTTIHMGIGSRKGIQSGHTLE